MNTKLLGKTLVASALILTTLGTGFHSSYLGLDTNKVVKTAKADSLTDGQLWLGVKKSLIDAQIISGNKDEEVKVSYVRNDGQSNSVTAYGNNNNNFSSTPSNFSKLKEIDLKKENIPANDFNTTLNSDDCWNKLTSKLKEQGLLTDGQKVTIHCNDKSNNTNTSVTGKVGEGISSGSGTIFTKRFIDKITIE
ncbi:DUF4888 domain-containing protein [Staphylococcus argenteus]|uniref:DUF4888 domain-containing protein n=1 Tax=Staphylococcus argenteus TaxID=985002 RepID=UPI001FB99E31|nr:DUF4888 domain-containing protein [Staphylococcus argenteus]MCG9794897.1 DUF4888 domain-containing protein [Staphylococcus argenteus]GJF45306.1 DUF4888 domain-containing protein [Staphylococcus argenteus]GJF60089.1 DUF4888 domain-containing protein [Staphylococcus argenteus]GJF72233.1 DUF4888 domain-containing protein [Staphylococcus argenteus]GJF86095.1 DUF4888 domain-containing protein [Staphylococcus argenteus]